jgi:hypothetical protein
MTLPTRQGLDTARRRAESLRRQMIATQEELDWRCYLLYGLLPARGDAAAYEHPAPPEVTLGERAFEIVLARRIAGGSESTTWFERHGSTPVTEIPGRWPEDYRQVVQRRVDLIESDRNIGLIERPEYKRRWNTPSWECWKQPRCATGCWPARVPRCWSAAPSTRRSSTTSRLADACKRDAEFMQIAELYAGHADFDPPSLSPSWSSRISALPPRAALHRHRPAQTCPVGRHLGSAAARGRWRRTSARSRCRPSTRARTS